MINDRVFLNLTWGTGFAFICKCVVQPPDSNKNNASHTPDHSSNDRESAEIPIRFSKEYSLSGSNHNGPFHYLACDYSLGTAIGDKGIADF